MKVVKAEIVLGNCESVIVPQESILFYSFNNEDAYTKGKLTLRNLDKLKLDTYCEINTTALQRLKQFNDITHVYLYDITGEVEHIVVFWNEKDYEDLRENPSQSVQQVDDILYINFK